MPLKFLSADGGPFHDSVEALNYRGSQSQIQQGGVGALRRCWALPRGSSSGHAFSSPQPAAGDGVGDGQRLDPFLPGFPSPSLICGPYRQQGPLTTARTMALPRVDVAA